MAAVPNSADSGPDTGLLRRALDGARGYLASVSLFSHNARLYLIGSFLVGFNFSVFQLLLNLYFKELGFVEGQIGWIQSSRSLGMTLVAIPAAILLSRVRLKPVLLVCAALMALFSFGLTSFTQFVYLVAFGFLAGVSFSFFRVVSGPFYMRNSGRTERTHLFSFSYATYLLAGMIGSYGAGSMVTLIGEHTGNMVLGYQYTMYAAIVISTLAMIPFSMIKASAPSPEESRIELNRQKLKVRGAFYFKITFVNFLVGLGAGLIIPFLNLYFRDRFGLNPDQIGLYYILLSAAMLVGTLSGPFLTPRFGLVRTVVVTELVSIPFMLMLAYTYNLYLAVPAFIVRGALMNMGVPIANNFAMELSDKREQGLVNALLMISWTGSWTVAVAIGGHIIEDYGYTVVLNVSAGLYIVSSVVYYLFFHGAEKRTPGGTGWTITEGRTA